MQKKINAIPFLMYVVIVATVLCVLTVGSCAFSTEGITMITGDYSSPQLEGFELTNEKNAVISFTDSVTFPKLECYQLSSDSAKESSAVLVGNVLATEIEGSASGIAYNLAFPEELDASAKYSLSGTVKDSVGSTLSFTVGYNGYNSRVPKMIFSEISTEYSNPKTEFIEFYVLEDGNLAGMILHSAYDGVKNDFIFPPVEVKKGEYVVLHMRLIEDGAVNELGDNISLSKSKLASSTGRDLYISNTESRLSKNDVLLLRNRLNGDLVDAVAYRDGEKSNWSKDVMKLYIQEAVDSGTWQGGVDVQNSVNVEKITATRTLCRQNIADIVSDFEEGITTFENSKDNWIIVATSNASPGKENSSKSYVP